jgi:hypothetical protein
MVLIIRELTKEHTFLWKEYKNYLTKHNKNEDNVIKKYFIFNYNEEKSDNDIFTKEELYMYNFGIYDDTNNFQIDYGCGYIFIEFNDNIIKKFRLLSLDFTHYYNIDRTVAKNNIDMNHLRLLKNVGFTIPDNYFMVKKPNLSSYYVSIFTGNSLLNQHNYNKYKLVECIFGDNNNLLNLRFGLEWIDNLHNFHHSDKQKSIYFEKYLNQLSKSNYYLYCNGLTYIAKSPENKYIELNQDKVKILLFDLINHKLVCGLADTMEYKMNSMKYKDFIEWGED